ncbi:hypothetical protein [Bacillus sp. AFS029533]|uniref:hypothetical protein n=1 Tax=Bacillus sp. AFS029533 TaxID=2033494 RepID=UPI000BFB1B51|nr:hypothetical protein [Bacillus sp. AFS029533]PGZ88986.1 hypothetical protein COE53_19175 [Bacillus sp. AFS029533]
MKNTSNKKDFYKVKITNARGNDQKYITVNGDIYSNGWTQADEVNLQALYYKKKLAQGLIQPIDWENEFTNDLNNIDWSRHTQEFEEKGSTFKQRHRANGESSYFIKEWEQKEYYESIKSPKKKEPDGSEIDLLEILEHQRWIKDDFNNNPHDRGIYHLIEDKMLNDLQELGSLTQKQFDVLANKLTSNVTNTLLAQERGVSEGAIRKTLKQAVNKIRMNAEFKDYYGWNYISEDQDKKSNLKKVVPQGEQVKTHDEQVKYNRMTRANFKWECQDGYVRYPSKLVSEDKSLPLPRQY